MQDKGWLQGCQVPNNLKLHNKNVIIINVRSVEEWKSQPKRKNKKQTKCIKKLRTTYPYGLNGNTSDE